MSAQIFEYSLALLELPVYPGVSIDESEVVRAWLRRAGRGFVRFEFGARVGVRDVADETAGESIDRMWAHITRPRPDVIASLEFSTVVVEAKVHARMRAVTQVRRYVRLLQRDRPHLKHVWPLVICRTADLGVGLAMQNAGGQLLELPLGPRVFEAPA